MTVPHIYPESDWLKKILYINNNEVINFIKETTQEHKLLSKIDTINKFLKKAKLKKIGIRNNIRFRKNYDVRWPIAINTLGMEWHHRLTKSEQSLMILKKLYDCQINQDGKWINPIHSVPQAMKGYSLIYLEQREKSQRYREAIENITKALLQHERESDGCLSYAISKKYILVDTLGMICPFLARYSKYYGNSEALELSINQLKQFIKSNVDSDTHFPYHGYCANGPKRLGIQGWGRGTGWFMLGLIDSILEIPRSHSDYSFLVESYLATAYSLKNFQREDGHWNWAILHRKDKLDSSTTSFIGYSLLRGLKAGILDNTFKDVVDNALKGLVKLTRSDGKIDHSLADCLGLSLYPSSFGYQPWVQGMTTAFASLYSFDSNNDDLTHSTTLTIVD